MQVDAPPDPNEEKQALANPLLFLILQRLRMPTANFELHSSVNSRNALISVQRLHRSGTALAKLDPGISSKMLALCFW